MSIATTRVIVGLSGGVDSAVAALLLLQQGYKVEGLFMSNWEEDDAYCTTAVDYQDARASARELGIVLHRVDFTDQYRAQVFGYLLAEYRAGRTPNPDVLCNREIKFGICRAYAARLGATLFATGHYARCTDTADGTALYKAHDQSKDQSYFLHAVLRRAFENVLFPIGEFCKDEVRDRARRAGIPVCDKPDSTGICFIGERPFAEFLGRYLPAEPGPIETPDGRRLGMHRGLPFYTLGQRAGVGVGGARGCAAEPWYVADKNLARNTLVVVQRHEQWRLEATAVRTGAVNWLSAVPAARFRAGVKLRYRQSDQEAVVWIEPDGGLRIEFDQPQRAATPGQFAVLYDGERCLGGAVIESAHERASQTAKTSVPATHAARYN
ncbi:MAG: tRNA 2-thiouridine(34) synthase MnmA [Steroidobacterales bacterium]